MLETTLPPGHIKPQFTPESTSFASLSDVLESSLRVSEVSPRIRRDIESHQTCKFANFLRALFKRCLSTDNSSSLDDAFQRCLKAAVDICNTDEILVGYLKDYCAGVTHKTQRYPPFVKLCNRALELWGESKDLPFHSATIDEEEKLLFHVADPKVMSCNHGERNPDVMLVDVKAARAAANSDNQKYLWEEISLRAGPATKPPEKNAFEWPTSYLTCKLKKSLFEIRTAIPSPYECNEPQEVEPKTPRSGAGVPKGTKSSSVDEAKSSISRMANEPPLDFESNVTGLGSAGRRGSKQRSRGQVSPHHKRGSGSDAQMSQKRQMFDEDQAEIAQLEVKVALYGVEHLAHLPFATSAMAISVVDSIAHLWWYDRQGAIQSAGLDFIKDLPHFLILLLTLQHLPTQCWGLPFPNSTISITQCANDGEMTIKLGKHLKSPWGIQGRGTTVCVADIIFNPPKIPPPLDDPNTTVAKFCWRQWKRMRESDVIQAILAGIEDLPDEEKKAVKGHIPALICWKEFEEYQTEKIRSELGIPVEEMDNRILTVSIFPRYQPITELLGTDFLRAWWDCLLCHRVLWKMGIHHRDISVDNLMYYKHKGRIMGMLNDYDLATVVKQGKKPVGSGSERTGTLPFMARDLLNLNALQGNVEHLYRHDFESFLWVLAWVAHRFGGGQEVREYVFLEWWQGFKVCRAAKAGFLSDVYRTEEPHLPTPSYDDIWIKVGKPLAKIFYLELESDETVDGYFMQKKDALSESGFDLEVNALDAS